MTEYIIEATNVPSIIDHHFVKGELIRCKDCKHWTFGENGVDGSATGICDVLKILTDETFYCAESERKE